VASAEVHPFAGVAASSECGVSRLDSGQDRQTR